MAGESEESDVASKGGLFALGVAIVGLILVHGHQVGIESLHLIGMKFSFNDQIVYIDAARHWIQEGELTSGAIYPSTLLQEYGRNFFYMPGHAAMTAIALSLFGDSAWAAMLPNWLAHGVCLFCFASLGRSFGGSRSGRFAVATFALTPIFLAYTFSAMSEMTALASGLLALTVFVHLPQRGRPWAVPALLLCPFLFRETGAFWITPMIALLLVDPGRAPMERCKAAMIALASSVAVLWMVYRIEWISDRPTLFVQNLFAKNAHEKYRDAFSMADFQIDFASVLSGILERGMRNLDALTSLAATASFESVSLHALFWLPLLGAFLGWRVSRLRPLIYAWALFHVTTFAFVTLLYRWDTFIGLRQMLPAGALGLLLLGCALAERSRALRESHIRIAVGIAWIVSLVLVLQTTRIVTGLDQQEAFYRSVLARTEISEEGVFVAPPHLVLIYLYDHPMRNVAFPPANRRTLERLEEMHDVRTALLQTDETRAMTLDAIESAGLEYRGLVWELHSFSEPD